ncbi:MAG TPA: PilZ domain-containing protein [Candidatus Angelobacter sp.]|nr:PilZ domain-containing protein [Candidatus Angelobacter sp.]
MQAPLTALLLCNEAQSLKTIESTFAEYSVETHYCQDSLAAQVAARQQKFDLLMIDFDEPGTAELLDFHPTDLWGYPSIVVAISSNPATIKQALSKRIHFTLQKPFSPDLVARTLKAGYSLIVNAKRTAFRHSVHIPASGTFLEQDLRHPLENVTLQDISQTGLCLQAENNVPKDATIFVDFGLPEADASISVIGKVMWSDAKGRVGVQFRFIPPLEHKQLRDWLSECCPWDVELTPKAHAMDTAQNWLQ